MNKSVYLLLLCLPTSPWAVTTDVTTTTIETKNEDAQYAKINKGDMVIGGGFNFNSELGHSDNTKSIVLYPSFEYFIFDHLSLGGSVYLSHGDTSWYSYTRYGIGPSATYYFLQDKKWTSFISQNAILNKNFVSYSSGGERSLVFKSSLGEKYFVTDAVALGVSAYYSRDYYAIKHSSVFDQDVGLEGQLSFHF